MLFAMVPQAGEAALVERGERKEAKCKRLEKKLLEVDVIKNVKRRFT